LSRNTKAPFSGKRRRGGTDHKKKRGMRSEEEGGKSHSGEPKKAQGRQSARKL